MGISCKEAVDYVSKNEEGKLTFRQKLQLWRHTAVCSLCKLFFKQNKQLVSSIGKHHHQQKRLLLPQEGKDAIVKALQSAEEN